MLAWLALGFSLLALLLALRAVKLAHKALRRRNQPGPLPTSAVTLPSAKQAAGLVGGHVTVLPKGGESQRNAEEMRTGMKP